MKVLFLGLALLTGLCVAQSGLAKSTKQTANNNQSVILDMQNMTCNLCKVTIKKALQGVDGVKTVTVDSDKKIAHVTFNDQKTTIEDLINATSNAGYPATVHPKK